jgi:TonB family protein
LLEEELKRVVKSMPTWTIAFKDGENAFSHSNIRYSFALPQHKIDWMKKLQKNDTTYYNKSGRIVSRKSAADSYEILSLDRNDSLKAIERLYYVSGKLKSEKSFLKKKLLNTAYDSVLISSENTSLSTKEANELIRVTEGKYSEWYENGKLSKEFYLKEGRRDGQLKMFWDNGNYRRKEEYQDGKLLEGKCYTKEGNVVRYFDVDSPCSFPGGRSALNDYLNKNLNYPINAIKNKKEGVVTVKFLVDKGGHISYTRTIASSVHAELTTEARRLILAMPLWYPQFKDGDPVVSLQSIQVNFSLVKSQSASVNTGDE